MGLFDIFSSGASTQQRQPSMTPADIQQTAAQGGMTVPAQQQGGLGGLFSDPGQLKKMLASMQTMSSSAHGAQQHPQMMQAPAMRMGSMQAPQAGGLSPLFANTLPMWMRRNGVA